LRFLAITLTAVLYALGIVMIFNTTSAEILDMDLERSTLVVVLKQLFYGMLGLFVGIFLASYGVKRWIDKSPALLALFSFFLLVCFFPVVGRSVNGSHRWITLGVVTFQPSEFVKLIAPAYFLFALRGVDVDQLTFFPFLKRMWPLTIPLFLILIEPNNGTVGVIGIALMTLCVFTRVPLKIWALPIAVATLCLGVVAVNLPYVRARLKVYMNPEMDLLGKGHQPYQAKIAAGSGGLFGRGPGSSLQKMSYLPEAQNDYIGAIYAEEFGFVGTLVLISSYMLLAYVGISIAYRRESHEEAAYIATLSFLIGFQAFMNLGVVSGLLPSTGLNLPFFSQGGTSLIANMGAIGLILSESTMKRARVR